MKRFLSLLLALIVVVGICFSAPLTIEAEAATVTAAQAINWCKERLGKALDYDGIYGAQCVDLIKYYYKYLAGVETYGNGEDYATNTLPSGWTRTKGGVPQKGDILVYVDNSVDGNGNQRLGHVAIYESDYSTYHQNYNGKYVENITKYYKNACRSTAYYWGCIHPNFAGGIIYSEITNGFYYLKNNSTGTYLAVDGGKDANGQAIDLWDKSEAFRVQITSDKNGYVMRFPGVSSTRVVNQYANAPVNGTKVTLYTYSGSTSQSWGFQKVSGGYVIRSMYNQNLCLTGNGSSVATVTNYTGASNQIWTLESYCTHSSTTTKNVKSATCTATGYTGDKYCSSCGILVSYGSATSKLGHSTSVINKKSATCTQTGYTGDTYCSRCKTTVSQGSIIAKLGHSTSVINAKTATCTQTGCTGDTYCSTCKTTISKGTTIAKIAHKTTVVNAKSATCTQTGYTGDTKCTVCGTVTATGKTIAKVAHRTTLTNVKNATTKETGYTGDRVCSVCQTVVEKGKEIPKLAVSLATPTVRIANTSKGIKVTWNAVENAESYIVYRRVYNASTKKWSGWSRLRTGITSTSYTDQTVKLGTNYRYTVRAVNGSVKSAYKTTSTLKYNVTPTVKIVNATTGIKVNWSTAANATGYTVYRSQYNTKTKKWTSWKNMGTVKANKTSWTDKMVTSGVKYKYTVRACNGKFKSDYKSSANLIYY